LQKSWLADLSLLLVAFVWGTTFVIVQNAISVLPPHTFNGIRFFLAAFFLLFLLLFLYPQQLKQLSRKMVFAGIILGFWLYGGYAFQTVGLLYTTSSKAGFITGLSVVLVPIFALIVLAQRPKWPAVLGVVAATIGLYLLTLGDSFHLNRGDVFVFFCAISFAGQIILTGKYAPNFPSMALALIQIATVSALSIISSFLFEDWRHSWQSSTIFTPDVLWALLITAGPATAFAFLAQTICQRFTTPTRVALIFAMEPVFAALTAFIWTDEILSTKAISGCLLIFVGMILSELKPDQISLKKRTNLVNR